MRKELEHIEEQAIDALSWLFFTAFTVKQRHALEERDLRYGDPRPPTNKGACAFPVPHECNGDKGTQKHHIKPQGYMKKMGLEHRMDEPENGISLCKNSHVGIDGVHPDNPHALDEYHHGNKEAFKELQNRRMKLLDERKIYWRDCFDRIMEITAMRNTEKAKKNGWRFPGKEEK